MSAFEILLQMKFQLLHTRIHLLMVSYTLQCPLTESLVLGNKAITEDSAEINIRQISLKEFIF